MIWLASWGLDEWLATPKIRERLNLVILPNRVSTEIWHPGKTLYEACESHDIRLGPDSSGGPYQERRSPTWVETTFGESVTTGYDHVVLTGKGANTVEPPDELELQALDDFWDPDYIFEGSRLASCITLNREMDGMVVYVGERLEHDFF